MTSPSIEADHRPLIEDDRTGMDDASLKRAFLDHLSYSIGKNAFNSTKLDRFFALALTVRDRLVYRWAQTQETYSKQDVKRVYYLSAEFLLGRALTNNLHALDLYDRAKKLLADAGLDISDVFESEPEPGLGNGGLGRLAACFLDSMATLGYAGYGYGIRYEFGIFEQELKGGWQVERPDEWLKFGNPWEFMRPEYAVSVGFGGRVEDTTNEAGDRVMKWVPAQHVLGVPFDTPIAGYRNDTVNTLRLWQARAGNEFDLQVFNDGDYVRAVEDKNASEVISKVLYPNDHNQAGRDLRLKQEYFFVACAVADIVRRYKKTHGDFESFAQKNAIQLNDTHPAIAVAELMRVLVDQEGVPWDRAWEITVATCGYTNHTLLAEALEKWPVAMFERLLPRHLQIIYEVNRRFVRALVAKFPGDDARIRRMSIIEEPSANLPGTEKKVCMAHLAVAGSHAVNGVAALHTDLLKRDVLRDFAEMTPAKFSNKTNGVTPRRWLHSCNPRLSAVITEAIGPGWVTDLERLEELAPLATDASFVEKVAAVKRANKADFAQYCLKHYRLRFDPDSLFDVQIKRLHEYKRQLLNALHVIRLYLDAKRDPNALEAPRTVLFGAKAAPGYRAAKLIIKLINSIADVVNSDLDLGGRLKVAFLPNYRVSLAERIIPASDLSEQISTAGKEASGTGNMKLAMNGALTIGTLDGANIEIRDAVGADNFFLFGLTTEEVHNVQRTGYSPRAIYEKNERLKEVIDLIANGFFSAEDPALFRPLTDTLLDHDAYLLLADFDAYVGCQKRVSDAFLDKTSWHSKAVKNIAKSGWFSSDRTIREYATEIWNAQAVKINLA
ncbi:MAG: glycogen/starch/alpha-glucan phosphorylase [Labilithrix sp.]|nr:glycogen/starch/alpha-glucan phosphorylase [Labilithrix sp.]MCW5814826.1 glycogen/starch/alpha-glucan phosphorylase [Labilithrix sp.]